MQKTPEAIIADFELRQSLVKIARRRKTYRRIADVARVVVGLVALFVFFDLFVPTMREPHVVLVGVFVLMFSWIETQKRWVLEDRIEELERKNGSG